VTLRRKIRIKILDILDLRCLWNSQVVELSIYLGVIYMDIIFKAMILDHQGNDVGRK
jgi:hypothetical protein